jgi:hypothetical protein
MIANPIGTSDQCTITAVLHERLTQRSSPPLIPNVWKADIDHMKIEAAQIDWNLEHIKEVNDCWDVFSHYIEDTRVEICTNEEGDKHYAGSTLDGQTHAEYA